MVTIDSAGSEEKGSHAASSRVIVLAFACVYFFWGSTYTAIRVAGEHLAPTLVSALRSLMTVALLVPICLVRGVSLRVPVEKVWRLALIGVLFMTCNNVLLTWAEKMVPSGLASLVVSTMPIAVALLEAMIPGGDALNTRGWIGTLLGTVGMAALVWPSLAGQPGGYGVFPFVLLFLCVLPFAIGSVLSRRFNFRNIDTLVAATWQLSAAAVANVSLALIGGTLHTAEWSWRGLSAIAYLAVFGSLVGYSAYTYLLKHVAVTKASTYAFINPIVAVLLGVVLLHERLEPSEMVGMVTIIAAVAMVIFSRAKLSQPKPDAIADAME